ncbi:HlyD family type I secretion periplasmic adaptor subunit [Roseovarius spongiae]|uniref:Membrane fusion protein (MFP) family protein n=1 Tax=Roseovarius spongiae TaxID=2320272 RepID=A0A3A8BBH1_9RHOB|nr:HlyD family type I secretion periplasmic adaptor subunit [Roseovarius spongiae]RKF16774.1 HlyD family type I secretion periplasmic adaptor subunit [Roseovarius spongiae]
MSDDAFSSRSSLVIGMLALLVLVGGLGGWAFFTELSGAVIAPGQIEVDRNRQIVQHPDGGVVAEIDVDEGDSVEKGALLVRLDDTQLKSELAIVESQLFEIMARRARLEAERDGADAVGFDDFLVEQAAERPKVQDVMDGQARLFAARAETQEREREQLEKQKSQLASQIEGIAAQQAALEEQGGLLQVELDNQQALLAKGLTQAARVLELRTDATEISGSLGELAASRAQAASRITEIEIEILKLGTSRREEAISLLRDMQQRELELTERRRAILEQMSRLDIRAPVAGVVYDLKVFALRSVIRPADPVLFIVPQDRPLIIAGRIETTNIDQVHVGQEVTLRFSAFDARTTPELIGHLTQVSADAFTDERTQQSFYRVEIHVDEGEYARLPEGRTLVPGMPVEAFIRTQDRSPIAYLVKPVADYFAKAFRES